MKAKLAEFIRDTLKMELSQEKTLITHSSECARFLSYDVRVRRDQQAKPWKKCKQRTMNNTVFDAELRGLCNYYLLASNYRCLNYFSYLMEYSCLKTLAGKHKCKLSKIYDKYRVGKKRWEQVMIAKRRKTLAVCHDCHAKIHHGF